MNASQYFKAHAVEIRKILANPTKKRPDSNFSKVWDKYCNALYDYNKALDEYYKALYNYNKILDGD